jgi:hypothetical protein
MGAVDSRAGVWRIALPLAALMQAGCVTTGGMMGGPGAGAPSQPLSPAEQRLRQQSGQLDAKTSLQGCAAGAVAGALLSLLAAGDREDNLMIGIGAGCAVGFATNAYIQTKRQQYQNNEMRIAAMTADVRAENQRVAALIATSEEVIAADRQRIAAVDAAYRKRAISVDQARRDLARAKDNRAQMQKTVDALRQKEADWIEISSMERQVGSDTAALDREIGDLRKRISSLEKELALMDRQINASPVAG